MRLAISGRGKPTIEIPLYKMVRELAKRVKSQSGITRFNNLPLARQLDYFDTEIQDRDRILALAEKIRPGYISELSVTLQTSRECELTSGSYMNFKNSFFVNGDERIYLDAQFSNGDMMLSPKLSLKNGVYVVEYWMLPSLGTRTRQTERRETISLSYNDYDGYCCVKDAKKYPWQIQEAVPVLHVNVKPGALDKQIVKMLKEAVSN